MRGREHSEGRSVQLLHRSETKQQALNTRAIPESDRHFEVVAARLALHHDALAEHFVHHLVAHRQVRRCGCLIASSTNWALPGDIGDVDGRA